MNDYAGLVEYIVRNMVDHPDAVVVEAQPGRGRSQTIEISLDPEDVGRVIGKGGRNIEAIRAVVKAASIKDHERVNVEVLADEPPPAALADAAEGEPPVDAATSEDEAGEADLESGQAPSSTEATAETSQATSEYHSEVRDTAE